MIELDGELINTVSIEAELATEEVLDACVGIVHEIETGDHTKLTNRDQPNQHPIEAIIGLSEALAKVEIKAMFMCRAKRLRCG